MCQKKVSGDKQTPWSSSKSRFSQTLSMEATDPLVHSFVYIAGTRACFSPLVRTYVCLSLRFSSGSLFQRIHGLAALQMKVPAFFLVFLFPNKQSAT